MAVERRDPARAEERQREVERRRSLIGEKIRLDGVHILLVEDDEDSRRLLGTMLKRHGAEVSAASSAADAFRLFTERRPDVLVSDIGMPEEDGYQLLKKIRALSPEEGGRVPALALTGYATRRDRERSFEAGYEEHMAKPVEQSELISVVSKLLSGHR
jgi:CheY-like chemotaxis protein